MKIGDFGIKDLKRKKLAHLSSSRTSAVDYVLGISIVGSYALTSYYLLVPLDRENKGSTKGKATHLRRKGLSWFRCRMNGIILTFIGFMMGQGQCTHMASGGLENMPIDHSLGLPSRRSICSCLHVSVCGVVASYILGKRRPFCCASSSQSLSVASMQQRTASCGTLWLRTDSRNRTPT